MKKFLIAATTAAVALGAAGAVSAQPYGNAYGYYRNYDRQEARAYERFVREQQRYERARERAWRRGQYLPPAYRSSSYVLRDYNRYGLPAPAYGQYYYRSGNDVLLGNSSTGLIVQVLSGLLGGNSGYYGNGYSYGYPYYR